jgi:glycosyltransferase involved in cell wall biosynthesis
VRGDEVLVGIVGRLTEIKNHDLFLRSAASYKEKYGKRMTARRTRFVLIGDGRLRRALEEQTFALGLAEDVIFAGSRKDPEFFYPALDIVALTSHNEGTPLTLIEAMLNQRPVIATTVGGVVDLLGDAVAPVVEDMAFTVCERGIRVRPGDEDGFAAGLARFIDDEALRHTTGERSRKFIEQNYSKERLLADIGGLYRDLLQAETVTVKGRAAKNSLESRV